MQHLMRVSWLLTKNVRHLCNLKPPSATGCTKQVMIPAVHEPKIGVAKMSSEELRLDLESFINEGLNRGLHGWPRKVREHFSPRKENASMMPLRTVVYPAYLVDKAGIGAFEAVGVF